MKTPPYASKIAHKFTSKDKTMITALNRVSRELLEIRHDIDSLNLQTQQLGVHLHSFMLELKRKSEVGEPTISIEEDV